MPFAMGLLDQLIEDYGFEKEYSVKCLEANRHNHITATYHLINKRNIRSKHLKEGLPQDPKTRKQAKVYYSQNARQTTTVPQDPDATLAQPLQATPNAEPSNPTN